MSSSVYSAHSGCSINAWQSMTDSHLDILYPAIMNIGDHNHATTPHEHSSFSAHAEAASKISTISIILKLSNKDISIAVIICQSCPKRLCPSQLQCYQMRTFCQENSWVLFVSKLPFPTFSAAISRASCCANCVWIVMSL